MIFNRSQTIAWACAVLVLLAGGDALVRSWQQAVKQLEARRVIAGREWDRARDTLSRADEITARYRSVQDQWPRLLSRPEAALVLQELDDIVRSAGARIEFLRPSAEGDHRVEIAVTGAWSQIVTLLSELERPLRAIEIVSAVIRSQELSKDIKLDCVIRAVSIE